jgi:hypothetical protein
VIGRLADIGRAAFEIPEDCNPREGLYFFNESATFGKVVAQIPIQKISQELIGASDRLMSGRGLRWLDSRSDGRADRAREGNAERHRQRESHLPVFRPGREVSRMVSFLASQTFADVRATRNHLNFDGGSVSRYYLRSAPRRRARLCAARLTIEERKER